jgi:hypothetical protein
MSDHHWENSLRIAEYLEDRMAPAEEEAFMRALGEDEELRRQYEEELLIRGRMRGARGIGEAGVDADGVGMGPGMLQPADEHLQMVTEILAKGKEVRKDGGREGAKIALLGKSGMVAAALLVIISGTVLYIRIGHRRVGEGEVKRVEKIEKVDTGIVSGGSKWMVVRPDSVYARLYEPYASGNDPVEVSLYYRDYKRGNYAAVLAAREEDYRVMGVSERGPVVEGYMRLYKGLACLATGKPKKAVTELSGAMAKSQPGDALYETAQWYLALAWLRRKDLYPEHVLGASAAIAHRITNTQSRYKPQAEELLRALGL